MRASKTQLLFRMILVVAVAVTSGVVFRMWQIRQPDYHWNRAEAALAAHDDVRGELELRNCLVQFPQHGPAHYRLASVLANRAERQHPGGSSVVTPEVLLHLGQAAALMPERLDVQQTMMRALIGAGRDSDAEKAAIRVRRLDAKDQQALLLVTRAAVRKHDLTIAADLVAALSQQTMAEPFTAWFLTAEYDRLADKPEHRAATIAAAIARAAALPLAEVARLSREEREALASLLVLGVVTAEDAPAATANAQLALRFDQTGLLPPLAVQVGTELRRKFPVESQRVENQPIQQQQIHQQVTAAARRQVAGGKGPSYAYQYLAESAIAEGDDAAAIDLLKQGIAASDARGDKTPQRLNLHLLCAARLLGQGHAHDAIPMIEPLLADPATAGQGHMLAASAALAEGRADDAWKHFQEARQIIGDTLAIRLGLATAAIAANRPADAADMLSSVVENLHKLGPQEKEWAARHLGNGLAVRRALCEALLAVDRDAEAAPHLAALRGSDQEPPALIALAAWHWRHAQRPRAEAVLAAGRRAHPDHIGLVLAHAAVMAQLQTADDADRLVASFAAAAADDLPRQLALVQWHAWRSQPGAALKLLPQLKARFDEPALWRAIEAQLLLAADRPQEALAAAEQLSNDPNTADAGRLVTAAAVMKLGRLGDATAILDAKGLTGPVWDLARARALAAGGSQEAALDLLGGTLRYAAVAPQARIQLGNALARFTALHGARAACDKASQLLARSPDDPWLLATHANLAIGAGETDVALADLERLDKVTPRSAVVAYLRAQALAAKNDLPRAAAEIKVAIDRRPDFVDARLLAARLASQRRDYSTMIIHAQAVLESDPASEAACRMAVEALSKTGRTHEALSVLRKLIATSPQNPQGYLMLAEFQEARGELQQAQATLAMAALRMPRQFEILAAEIALRAGHGQAEEARKLGRTRAAAHPEAFAPEQMADLMLRLKQYDEARHWAEQFKASAGPRIAEAHWLLGNIALVEGQRDHNLLRLNEAAQHFRAVLADHPDHFGAANNLAYVLATELGQPQEASQIVGQLMLRPEFKQASAEQLPLELLDTAATVMNKAGRPADAIKLLAPVAGRFADNASLQFQLGLAQLGTGNLREADLALKAALRLGLAGHDAEQAKQEIETISRQGEAG